MGANSTQGVAIAVFLIAFSCLGTSLFLDGNIVMLLLSAVGLAASVPLFMKARRIEFGED